MSEWISVKDRLPKVGERVIVVYEYEANPKKYVGVAQYFSDFWPWKEDRVITHWMPLPDVPKE
jgi:hypothetical protein